MIDSLEHQTKEHLCTERFGKIVMWMFYYFDGNGNEDCWKERQGVEKSHTFGYEEGTRATKNLTAI